MKKYPVLAAIVILFIDSSPAQEHWILQKPPFPPVGERALLSIAPLTSSTAITVGGDGTILRTEDGGTNWVKIRSWTRNVLQSVSFSDPLNGVAVGWKREGSEAIVLTTTDGGQIWEPGRSYTQVDLRDVFMVDKSHGYAVGGGWRGGTIMVTVDGGKKWALQYGTGQSLDAVFCLNQREGWVAGQKTILHTTDAGNHWTEMPHYSGDSFVDLFFFDSNTGFAVGNTTLLGTTDGGEVWRDYAPDAKNIFLSSIYFVDQSTGYLTGNREAKGAIFITTDRGINWTEMKVPTCGQFTQIRFKGNTGFAVTRHEILRYR